MSDRIILDRIESFSSPIKTALESRAVSPITITFANGRAVTLSVKDKREQVWGKILESLHRQGRPVYVELDATSSAIANLLIPLKSPVRKLGERAASGGLQVDLTLSSAVHLLRSSHPKYGDFAAVLQEALATGAAVLVTETPDTHEIIDVRRDTIPEPADERKPVATERKLGGAKLSPVTPNVAQQFFDQVSGLSCDPEDPLSPCIPFMYPDDGCWARAHRMCQLMADAGQESEKVWIHRGPTSSLRADTLNHPNCAVEWGWHVAPVLDVSIEGATETWVIDPSLFPTPVPLPVWVYAQNDPDATTEITDRSLYMKFGGPTADPTGTLTQQDMQHYRDALMQRFAATAGPPFLACRKPDLFIRDNLDDSGLEPLARGGISCSPDINHFRNELADPGGTLGSVSAKMRGDLAELVEYGQPNYIYVRLQNRGSEAADATIDIYYSLASSLPTPSSWQLVGTLSTSSPVSPGDFKVVGPLQWDTVPQVGHYCFIAVIDSPKDPKPDLSQVHTVDDFYNLIRVRNNVTWKNFDVENYFADSTSSFDFLIRGWPRIAYKSDLEIDASLLPADAKVQLRILKRLTSGASLQNLTMVKQTQTHVVFEASTHGHSAIRQMPLNPSDQSAATVFLTTTKATPDGAYQFAVIQSIDGKEVGRITRRLNIGKYPYMGNNATLEVHVAACEWAAKIGARHKVAFQDTTRASWLGYNGCAFCLPELDTDH